VTDADRDRGDPGDAGAADEARDECAGPPRARRTYFSGVSTVETQAEARAALAAAPDCLVLVERGRPRAAVFECPCGCGDVLAVNLDPAAGRAWRVHRDDEGVTLMPSVWRADRCRSHFIVWRSAIWWCGTWEEVDETDELPEDPDWPGEMIDELRAEWRAIRRRWEAGLGEDNV
jgi:hypothetical protein